MDDSGTTSNTWHYVVDGETLGPVDSIHLAAQAEAQVLTPETLVWREGMDNWATAKMTELASLFAPDAGQGTNDTAQFSSPASPAHVDETRLRPTEPKLAAFRDPSSPLAQAIAARPTPQAPGSEAEAAPLLSSAEVPTEAPPSKPRSKLFLALCILLPLLAGMLAALWFYGLPLGPLRLP